MKEALVVLIGITLLFVAGLLGFPQKTPPLTLYRNFSTTTVVNALQSPDITLDSGQSAGGSSYGATGRQNGALKVHAHRETHYTLVSLDHPPLINTRLYYRAKLKTNNLDGRALLDITAKYAGNHQEQCQGVLEGIEGNTGWTTVQAPFFIQKNDPPEKIMLGITVEGRGTAWIDNIQLYTAPL